MEYCGVRILNLSNDDTGEFLEDSQPLGFDNMGTELLNIEAYQFKNYQTIRTGINDTLFYKNNPPIDSGDNIWFRVKGYSRDSTLVNYSPIALYSPENITNIPVDLNNNEKSIFSLYPNPSSKVLNIVFNQEFHTFHYQIPDLAGKMLSESNGIISDLSGKRIKHVKAA